MQFWKKNFVKEWRWLGLCSCRPETMLFKQKYIFFHYFLKFRFIQGGSFVNFLKVTTLVSTLVSLFLWPLIWPLILGVRPCGEPDLPRRGRDHRRVPRHNEQLRCWTESLSGLSIDLSNLIYINLCPPPSYPQPCTTYTLRPVLPTFSPDLSSDFSSDFSSVPHLTPHLTSPP